MRVALFAAAAFIAAPLAAQDHQVIHVNEPAGLPFSSAVRVGNLLFLAGQTRQIFENIKTVLAASGSSLERVVKCTVFLTNIADYQAMNTVYATYFPKDPPARSTVAGSGLALGARVEIECIATAG